MTSGDGTGGRALTSSAPREQWLSASVPGAARSGRYGSESMNGQGTETRMRAAQVTGPGKVRLLDLPLPEPAAGEVRVRLEGCGVCASNLGPWSGPPWMNFPLEPGELGHEAWGRVDATGPGVTSHRSGDRVAVLGLRGYATHDLVSAEAALHLPPVLDGQPLPGEPLGCAFAIFHRARVARGETVVILGIGFLGALLTGLAAEAGARVVALSRRPESLQLARSMGAAETVRLDDHGAVLGRLGELTGGAGCDVAIECTGHQWPLDLAAESLREGGRLVIAGYHQDGPRQVNMQLWNWRALDIVNAHERDQSVILRSMQEAIDAVAAERLRPAPLYTHRFPLDELAEALDATRDKPQGFVKALVVMP
jgi:NADPH:quinone reductase